MSTVRLSFMGQEPPEDVRCRVYVADDPAEQERVAFVRRLADAGILDCPAYDGWIAALLARGYVTGELEPNPSGPGRVKRWRLSESGRAALGEVLR